MKQDKDSDLIHEAMQSPARVAEYLRALADGLDSGDLRLSSGERELCLHPPSLCTFHLRASSEPRRVKLRVELGWRAIDPSSDGQELRISSR